MAMTSAGKSRGRVGILVKTYPKLSETFVLGEILGLEHRGVPLALYALQSPTDSAEHPHVARVQAPVAYLPSRGSIVPAHLRCMARHPLRYLGSLRLARGTTDFLRAGWLADRLIADGIRHLHVHFASQPATVGELACRIAGIPFSISAHAKDIYLTDDAELSRKLGNAAFTVTCTEHNLQHLARLAPPGARVQRMYHGIDTGRFQPREASGRQRPLVISIGRLRAKKGFDILVRACRLLRNQGVEFDCEIIGYGPEEAALRALIATCRLEDSVSLVGTLTQDEVIERLAAATLFVLPCRVVADGDRDGIPNVLLEAMAMQLPVVSTDVSGIPEVLTDGETGLLVPPDQAPAVASAMQQLIRDDELRSRLGQNGRQRVEEAFSGRNLDTLVALLDDTRAAPNGATAGTLRVIDETAS